MKYIVRLYMDNTYEVLDAETEIGNTASHFKGSLADCEAWIRLTEAGIM